jgi:GMP synthase-like glutamine amidotransferase
VRVHYLQHESFEGLGGLEPWFLQRGADLTATLLYDGESLPRVGEFDWLVVMGGPMSANDEAGHPWLVGEKRLIADAIAAGRTVVGVCLGAQLVAAALGARVYRAAEREIGWFPVERTPEAATHPVGAALPPRFLAFQWHGDTFDLPPGAVPLARSAACERQAFAYGNTTLAVQFHPEMRPEGARELVAACPAELRPARYVQSPDEILRDPGRFDAANALMVELLERLLQAAG